jgi:hypothetical protein
MRTGAEIFASREAVFVTPFTFECARHLSQGATFAPIAVIPYKGDRMNAGAKGPGYYHAEAEHCRKLAKAVSDPRAESELSKLAAEFDARASLAEIEADAVSKEGQTQIEPEVRKLGLLRFMNAISAWVRSR